MSSDVGLAARGRHEAIATSAAPGRGPRHVPQHIVRWIVLAVVAVPAVTGVLLAWSHYTASTSPTASDTSSTSSGPTILTHDQVVALVGPAGHSIYWAGAQGMDRYEVTVTGRDVYLRYVPQGVAAGSATPYLTVGTYERANAYQNLQSAAAVHGARSERLAGGALVVQPANKATSAYFAFPGYGMLMEVYDPVPGRALELVQSGAVQPIS